jgi:hypothetical protein
MKAQILIATLLAASATSAIAATYNIDPTHTYPASRPTTWACRYGAASSTRPAAP